MNRYIVSKINTKDEFYSTVNSEFKYKRYNNWTEFGGNYNMTPKDKFLLNAYGIKIIRTKRYHRFNYKIKFNNSISRIVLFEKKQ